MKTSLTACIGSVLLTLLSAATAHAASLSITELDQLDVFLQCQESCTDGKTSPQALSTCLSKCPAAPSGADKDLSGGALTWRDSQLAWLEYWDGGTKTRICTQNGAVLPLASCSQEACRAARPAADCDDQDHDGLPKYVEDLLGTSDAVSQAHCVNGNGCNGFQERCVAPEDANGSWCVPRTACPSGDCTQADFCPGGVCTAFHLDTVANDDDQLIVRVYYDYSPTPATVLDLRLDYDPAQLSLADARPMPAIVKVGKDLTVRAVDDDTLRLIVLGVGNTTPIPNGAVAELIFRRVGARSASPVALSTDPYFRQTALAPAQGASASALTSNSLWGPTVKPSGLSGKNLRLYYSFDNGNQLNPVWSPQDTNRPQTGSELCDLDVKCGADVLIQNRYTALQKGFLQVSRTIDGPSGRGVYFDGFANHIELPMVLNDPGAPGNIEYNHQDYTVSFWMYNDDDPGRGGSATNRVVFSRNTVGESTGYGIAVQSVDSAKFNLVFFENDITTTPTILPISTGSSALNSRSWVHVAMTYTAATQATEFFVNGVQMCSDGDSNAKPCAAKSDVPLHYVLSSALTTYPQVSGRALTTHTEGDLAVGRRSTDQIFFSSSQNNLYGIERMDVNGLDRTPLLPAIDSSARDVDYSPVADLMVYSSSASGNYEIWLANADGTSPRRITANFGDTAQGIFARRPRWSYDGKGIVFESNVSSAVLGDNVSRSYNLYFIEFDPKARALFIGGSASGPAQLDYAALFASQSTKAYRLTPADTGNYTDAHWLRPGQPGTDRGELVANFTDRTFRNGWIKSMVVQTTLQSTQTMVGDLHPRSSPNYEEELLATDFQGGDSPVKRYFFKRKSDTLAPNPQFAVLNARAVAGTADTFEVDVVHTPTGYSSACWDLNADGIPQPATEDLNGDTQVTVDDCYPSELGNLFIGYPDGVKVVYNVPAGTPYGALPSGFPASKKLKTGESFAGGTFVTVGVEDPISSRPIPAGVIATLRFRGPIASAGRISAIRRVGSTSYFVQTGTQEASFAVAASDLSQIVDADFSSAGDRLVLAGFQNARPVIATTKDLSGTTGMQKISTAPTRTSGLQWIQVQRFYPAAWVGAYRNGQTRLYQAAFRGGLDELRVWSYVRDAGAFDSESALGHERLVKEKLDGVLGSASVACTTSIQCPSYQQCSGGQCKVVGCPNGTCAEGRCTLLPVPAGNDGRTTTMQQVCYSECSAAGSDTECFSQECYNGPCRFCTSERACVECKPKQPHDIGGIQLFYADGCPDRNSYACESGSCVSECYSFNGDQSQYLCNVATEYCKEGRCVAFDWSWNDLSPFTFAAGGEVKYDQVGAPDVGRIQTAAIPQLYQIEVQAYGSEDYFEPPEIWVQGRVVGQWSPYGTAWFDLGRISVYNKTSTEAKDPHKAYHLLTQEPVTALRFQLVERGWPNPNAFATGTMTRNRHFCGDAALPGVPKDDQHPQLSAPIPPGWNPSNDDTCFRRPSGSLEQKGYLVGFLESESRVDCMRDLNDPKRCGVPETEAQNPLQRFLRGGSRAAIILAVKVDGIAVPLETGITKNSTCSYEGNAEILNGAVRRKLWFGDVAKEQSVQKYSYFSGAGTSPLADFTTVSQRHFGLLNCPYANPAQEGGAGTADATDVAELVVDVSSVGSYPTRSDTPPLKDNPNSCTWEVSGVNVSCFEWTSGPSFDSFNQPSEAYRTLDIDTFRASGFN